MSGFDLSTLPPHALSKLHEMWALFDDGKPRFDSSPDMRSERACYHEAGHAAAQCMLLPEAPIHVAFACANGGAVIGDKLYIERGLVEAHRHHHKIGRLVAQQAAVTVMAGTAAEARYLDRSWEWCAERNLSDQDRRNLSDVCREWQLRDGKRKAKERACDFVRLPSVWAAITDLAIALKAEGAISGDRIDAICRTRIDWDARVWLTQFPRARKK